MSDKQNTVAVFDFDGTITKADTFRDFFIWSYGPLKFYMAFMLTAPLVFLYLVGLVRNDYPKSMIFRIFFRGCTEKKYLSLCRDYAVNRIPHLVRSGAMDRIRWHKAQGHTLVVNSASLGDWIKPWASSNGFDHVVATGAECSNGVLTGDFQGLCSYGVQKVAGLRQLEITSENSFIYAYGDSKGDRDLLAMADSAEFRAFH